MDDGRLWNLSPYEVDRAPHPIPKDDGRVIHTTGRLLENELQCAICLDILRNTRTTKDCLHRFCTDCIEKSLRSGKKECPNCRTKLISMRSLRPDPLFDDIISTIFPERRDADEKQAALLARIGNPTTTSTGFDGRKTEEVRPSVAGISVSGKSLGECRVSLEISPFTDKMPHHASALKNWKPWRRLVRVTSEAKVSQVCRFIVSRLIVEQQSAASVDVAAIDITGTELYVRLKKADYRLLSAGLSLKEVQETYWRITRPIQLYFVLKQNFRLPGLGTNY